MNEYNDKLISRCVAYNGGLAGVYGLGFLGAALFYLQTATTLSMDVVGVAKALIWPAVLVYSALKAFGG